MDIVGFLSAAWQGGVQSVFTVLSFPLAVLAAWAAWQRREVRYFVERWPMSAQLEQYAENLRLVLEARPVGRVEMFTVEVRNGGRADLRAEDWLVPFRVDFGPHARVVDSSETLSTPAGIPAQWVVGAHAVELQPLALTHGDRLRTTFWVLDASEPQCSGRVFGVRRLRAMASSVELPAWFTWPMLASTYAFTGYTIVDALGHVTGAVDSMLYLVGIGATVAELALLTLLVLRPPAGSWWRYLLGIEDYAGRRVRGARRREARHMVR
jgi:hypothetical protein